MVFVSEINRISIESSNLFLKRINLVKKKKEELGMGNKMFSRNV